MASIAEKSLVDMIWPVNELGSLRNNFLDLLEISRQSLFICAFVMRFGIISTNFKHYKLDLQSNLAQSVCYK